jgi:hypothetical protein
VATQTSADRRTDIGSVNIQRLHTLDASRRNTLVLLEKQPAVAVFLAPASDGRRIRATFTGFETGTALMLMPMVLAQLAAPGKPSKESSTSQR